MNTEDKNQDEQIKSLVEELKKKTPWIVFVWAIGLLTTIYGLAFAISTSMANSASIEAKEASFQVNTVDKKVISIEATQKAQYEEITKSLDRIEKRFGTK